MRDIEFIIKNGEEKLKEFQEIESLLSYPEIIADELYYKHLLMKKTKLNNVAKITIMIIDQIGQYEKIKNELNSADAELALLINNELDVLQEKINKNAKLLKIMLLGNSEDEIVVELCFNTNNTKIIDKILQIYQNYCNKYNLKFDFINFDISNNSNCEIKISGRNAYQLFKNEVGIHKIIYDKEIVLCEIIIYEYIEKQDFILNENELKIETFRSSGAGGQHINRTNSAVRLTHIPTGIAVKCQNQRNQIQNKNDAYKILISKLSSYYKNLHIDNLLSAKYEAKKDLKRVREYDFNNNIVTDLIQNISESLNNIINGDLDLFNTIEF